VTVYVDKLTRYPNITGVAKRYGNYWCHMWADTLDELHAMADRIYLQRGWFQDRQGFPHYDMVQSRRLAALKAGAVEKSLKDHIREQLQL